MFSMTDAVIGLSILAIVLAGVLTWRADVASDSEADRAAAVFVSVHRAAERYLEDRYPHIERCLNGAQWAARWRQRRLDVVNSVAGSAEPPNASNFIPVPLYPDAATAPSSTQPGYLGPRTGPTLRRSVLGVPAAGACLPSLAAAGVLPASLGALRYDGTDASAHLYADRYDLRLIARLVQLDPDPGALEPVLGVQMLLTMKTPAGEPLPYRSASAIAERTRLASVGLLSSIEVGSAAPEQRILGFGGGWALDVCIPAATQLARETTAVRTLTAFDPGLATYPNTPPTGLGRLLADSPGFDLEVCRTSAVMGDVRTVALYRGTADAALLALSRASTYERLSGADQDGDSPASARVVAIVHRSRSAAMRTVLHREPIPGFAELQRMETDIDAGGYGTVNSGFLAGVDTDGDGIINQGTQVVGPPASAHWTSGDAPPPGFVPTTFHGPVHFRGPVVIHDGEFPLRTDLAGDPGKASNFQPGTLVVSGPTFLDPDPQRLIDGATPVVRAQVDGNHDWTGASGDAARLFGPGSLRVRASSDDTLAAEDQHGMISLLAGRVSLGAFSGVPVRDDATQALIHAEPKLHTDIDKGPTWAYQLPRRLEAADVMPGGTAAADMAARDLTTPRASLELFTAAPDAPAMLATEHPRSGVFLTSGSERSPVRAQTVAAKSDVALLTAEQTSPIHVSTDEEDSPVQLETAKTDAGLWLRTVLGNSPIFLGTEGDNSRVALAATGEDGHVDIASTQGRIAVAALDDTHTVPHDHSTMRASSTDPVGALDLGVWSAGPATIDSYAALHTEVDNSHIDIFTKQPSSKIAVAAAHSVGRRTDLDPTEVLDLGTWSPEAGVALHTDKGSSPVDVFTKDVTSKIVVAAASSTGKRSGADAKVLDMGTWSAEAPAALHTEAAKSPIEIYTVAADSPADLYTKQTDSPIDVRTEADAVPIDVHTKGAGSALALYTEETNSPASLYTTKGNSPVQVYTKGPGSLLQVYTEGSTSALSAYTEGATSPIEVFTDGETSSLAMYTTKATSPAELFTKGSGSSIDVRTEAASTPLVVRTQGQASGLSVRTEANSAGIRVHTQGSGAPLNLYTQAEGSNAFLRTEAGGSRLDMYTEGAGSGARLFTTDGNITINSKHGGGTSPDGNVYMDPDEFRFKFAAHHIDNLQLASALGGTAHPYASTFNTDGADAGDCHAGLVTSKVALPTGWSRSEFAAERTVTITVTVPGHGSNSADLVLHEPYTGWSADPVSGADDGTGATSAFGTVDFTHVVLCKISS